jgi:cyclic-di-GMP phosphodiesterase TipF (flagellum assembly factor)
VESFAQPIVRLPSRRLAYLELFGRIRARAGIYLPAQQYRDLAEKETLLSEVDNILLRHALDSIRADARRSTEIGYFINISSLTLKNVGFMSNLLEFIRSNRDLAHNLIFEFQQADFDSMGPQYLNVLKGLAKLGCQFSLDHISHPDLDAPMLRELNVRFVKVIASELIRLTENNDGVKFVEQIKTRLDRSGISMIVERLENERDLKEVLDFEIDYGEGFLFVKPDLDIAYRPKKTA